MMRIGRWLRAYSTNMRVLVVAAIAACHRPTPEPMPAPAPAIVMAPGDASPPAMPTRGVISAGVRTACARTADGRVSCWGEPVYARGSYNLGQQNPTTPIVIAGLADIVGVDAGESQHCAWSAHGEVWCWGWTGRQDERAPKQVPGLADVVEVAGARLDRMMCARR